MKSQIFPALKLTFLCLILFSVIYPLSVWAIAQLAPNRGRGEVVEKDGRVVGFAKVGQSFTDDKYFNSRPSAVSYNAAGSGGSKQFKNVSILSSYITPQYRRLKFLLN
jgi:potassium-transporting ATPase KdpC subunit